MTGRRNAKDTKNGRDMLMDELEWTRGQIEQAYMLMNNCSDPDMLDSCIYEIKAREKRYSYIIRKLKEEAM